MDKKSVGQRIQRAREKAGLSQAELAEKVGLSSAAAMSAIECGVRLTRLDKFVAIANALDTTADDLLQDVLTRGYESPAAYLNQVMDQLPPFDRKRLLKIIEVFCENLDDEVKLDSSLNEKTKGTKHI